MKTLFTSNSGWVRIFNQENEVDENLRLFFRGKEIFLKLAILFPVVEAVWYRTGKELLI